MALSRALLISGTRLNFAYDVDYDTAKRNFVPLTPAFNYTSANDALEIFSAVTCALSIIGSLVIILSYIFIREIRSKARELLVHISIMNLIYTTANFVGLIVPYDKCLFHRKGREHCNFKWLCEAQAFLGAYGTAGSILWTLGLSLYSYFGLARLDIDDHCLIKGIVIVLYVVCYLLPLYPSLWLLLGGHLGFPQSAHEGGGWCTVFIENDNKNASNYDQDMPLIMADGHGLWTWVAFMMMLHICLVHKLVDHCPMRIAKVIGDTGQGFVNFVFFCVLQAKVRQYVKDVIRRCWDCCNHDDVIDDESFTASVTPSQMSSCSSDPQRDRIED